MRFLPVLALLTLFASAASAQKGKNVSFKLRNNSLLPRKVVVVSYQPSTPGNGTQSYVAGPKTTRRVMFEEGTKIYLANADQVDYVMSGKLLPERGDTPFCTITAAKRDSVYVMP